MKKSILFTLIALGLSFGLISFISMKVNQKIVVLDPGHGGKDPGQIGKNGKNEKDVTLQLANQLKKMSNSEVKYVLTKEEDNFMDLADRILFIKDTKPDLVISIHTHFDKEKTFEVSYAREHENTKASKDWADQIVNKIKKDFGTESVQEHTMKSYILKNSDSPAILFAYGNLEVGNQEFSEVEIKKVAQCIHHSILEFKKGE